MRKYKVKSKMTIEDGMFSVQLLPEQVWRLVKKNDAEVIMKRTNIMIKISPAMFIALFKKIGSNENE